MHSYGVPATAQHMLAPTLTRRVRHWSAADRDALCTALWRSGLQEQGAIVCYLYRHFAGECGEREFRLFTNWLDRYVHNWAHTNGLALRLLGASLANEPGLMEELSAWTVSPNRWKRRAAAVSLMPSARKGLHTAAIFQIAEPLLPDPDEIVQKGCGLLLKETYPRRPLQLMRFLLPRRLHASRLLLRYAAEKVTEQDRARLLAR